MRATDRTPRAAAGDRSARSVWPGAMRRASRGRTAAGVAIAVVGSIAATPIARLHGLASFRGLPYLVVIVAATVVGRLIPGMLAVLCSAVLLDYYVLGEGHGFTLRTQELVAVVAFAAVTVVLSVMVSAQERAREDARAGAERLAFVDEASRVLGSSLDYEDTLRRLAGLFVPRVADWCSVDLLDGAGRLRNVAVAHSGRERLALAYEVRGHEAQEVPDSGDVAEVIRTGTPRLYRTIPTEVLDAAVEANPDLARLGMREFRSAIVVPLPGSEAIAGVLTLVSTDPSRRYGEPDLRVAETLAKRAGLAIEQARSYQAEQEAREAAERAQRRLLAVSAASRALAVSLDLDATLQEVVRLAIAQLAQTAVVYMADERGELRSVALAARDPAQEPLLRRLDDTYRPSGNPASHVRRAFEAGRTELMEDFDIEAVAGRADGASAEILRALGVRSGMALPLALGERVVGVLALSWTERTHVDPEDVAFGEELARRMARAIENARLFASEQQARARLALVSNVSEMLAESLDYPTMYERLARLMVGSIADLCLIDVIGVSDGIERVAAVHADPERQTLADELLVRPPVMGGPHPVARVLTLGRAEMGPTMTDDFLRETTREEEHLRIVRELGFHSFMSVPLVARGRTLGALTLLSTDPSRSYGPDDLALAAEIARRAAVRIDNARLYAERDHIARVLQRSLLPPDLPDIAGLTLAAGYRPGRDEAEVGGDFYDVFELPNGAWSFVVGDVCGRGPEAAATTGFARDTIRAVAMRERHPRRVAIALNGQLRRRLSAGDFLTAVCAYVVPGGTVRITLTVAGHPPPAVFRGGAMDLIQPSAPLLGVFDQIDAAEEEVELHPGQTLLLYTDGLIDGEAAIEPGSPLAEALAAASVEGPHAVVATALSHVAQAGRSGDDVAVLAISPA